MQLPNFTDTQKKALILTGIALVTILFVVLLTIVIVQFARIAPLKKQKAEAEAKLEQILTEKETMTDALKYIEGNKFIEEYARNELGYGKPGEMKFVPKNQ